MRSTRKMRKWFIGAGVLAFSSLLTWPLSLPWKLVEHALLSWVDDEIEKWVGAELASELADPIALILNWGPPWAIALLCLTIAYWWGTRKSLEQVSAGNDHSQIASELPRNPMRDLIIESIQRRDRISSGLEINPNALKLEVGESGAFFRTKSRNLYQTKRTLNLKVENVDRRFPITRGKLQIIKIEPQTEYHGPWLLEKDLTLAAGDHEFVPLVEYGEAAKSNHETSRVAGDSFAVILVDEPSPKLAANSDHLITIRATSLDTEPLDFLCKIYVDSSGLLRIESVASQSTGNAAQTEERAIEVSLGDGPEFEDARAQGDHICRTIRVCIENPGSSGFVSNCEVHAEFNGVRHLLVNGFTLLASEKRYVPIAIHHEIPSDKFIHVPHGPGGRGFFAEATNYLKLPLTGTLLTIKATCSEAKEARVLCRVFTDDTGKLRYEVR